MSSRHLGRIITMQSLYEWDFWLNHPDFYKGVFFMSKKEPKVRDIYDKKVIKEIIKGNITKHDNEIDEKFVYDFVLNTIEKHQEIDKIIVKNAPEWPLLQIAAIDRSILRLSIYELLYRDDVPAKVAIDEAVELAKEFGGENSSKFVNGVLGTVYKSSKKFEEEEHEKGDLKIGKTIKINKKKEE